MKLISKASFHSRIFKGRRGQAMVEYVTATAILSAAIIAAMAGMRGALSGYFSRISFFLGLPIP
jgi:Flp pilus assembly pilin Flp